MIFKHKIATFKHKFEKIKQKIILSALVSADPPRLTEVGTGSIGVFMSGKLNFSSTKDMIFKHKIVIFKHNFE